MKKTTLTESFRNLMGRLDQITESKLNPEAFSITDLENNYPDFKDYMVKVAVDMTDQMVENMIEEYNSDPEKYAKLPPPSSFKSAIDLLNAYQKVSDQDPMADIPTYDFGVSDILDLYHWAENGLTPETDPAFDTLPREIIHSDFDTAIDEFCQSKGLDPQNRTEYAQDRY